MNIIKKIIDVIFCSTKGLKSIRCQIDVDAGCYTYILIN